MRVKGFVIGSIIYAPMLLSQSWQSIQAPEPVRPELMIQPQQVVMIPCQQALEPPTAVVGLSGYHGTVPLAWKPVAADTLIGYDVYRRHSASGPYYRVATSIKNSYYRDQNVSAGVLYHYQIKSIYPKSESGFSASAGGSAQDLGYVIQSAYTDSAPVADGTIQTAEWSKTTVVDIRYPGLTGTVKLYVQNDQNRLYLAVDDSRNTTLENWDAIGIFFDRDMDREWCSDAGAEGLVQVYWDNGTARNRYMAVHGKWPNKLTLENTVVLASVSQGISAASGHVQTEIFINLKMAPFNYLPYSAIGFLIYAFDGGSGQFNGAWPQKTASQLPTIVAGYNWAYGPFSYGDLYFSPSAPSDFWADIDGDHDVDVMDIQLVAGRWGADRYAANYQARCDVNSDGYIDIYDIQLVASWWNKPLPSTQIAKANSTKAKLQVIRTAPDVYELWIDGAEDLAAFELECSATGADLLRMELGEFLGRTGNMVIALPVSKDASRKTITLGAFSYGDFDGAGGRGKLAEILLDHSSDLKVGKVKGASKNGQEVVIELEPMEYAADMPEFLLVTNHPNPFNSATVISFSLPIAAEVTMTVANAHGQIVEQQSLGRLSAGHHEVVWDGSHHASGVYLCRIGTQTAMRVIKLALVR